MAKHYKWSLMKRNGKRVKCARDSMRTKRIGRHGKVLRICCPPGEWKPRAKRKCKVGMRAYEIGTPK